MSTVEHFPPRKPTHIAIVVDGRLVVVPRSMLNTPTRDDGEE